MTVVADNQFCGASTSGQDRRRLQYRFQFFLFYHWTNLCGKCTGVWDCSRFQFCCHTRVSVTGLSAFPCEMFIEHTLVRL